MSTFLSRGFADHPVEPLAQPVDTRIEHVGHDELFPELSLPGVRLATTFLPSDHAEKRAKRMRLILTLRRLLVVLAPEHTPPVPTDEASFLSAVYPDAFRAAWDGTPALPPELRDSTIRSRCSRCGAHSRRTYACHGRTRWSPARPTRVTTWLTSPICSTTLCTTG